MEQIKKAWKYLYLLVLLVTKSNLTGQVNQFIEGQVSYISTENIYVKFPNTQILQIGDTLSINDIYCLRILKKSSTSVICDKINNCNIVVGTMVKFLYVEEVAPIEEVKNPIEDQVNEIIPQVPQEMESAENAYVEKFDARISFANYVYFNPDIGRTTMRNIGRVSGNYHHIQDSKFSFDTYLIFRNNQYFQEGKPTPARNNFRVFNLAMSYDINASTKVWLGRKINNNLASLGAIDGLQVEKKWGNWLTGAIFGFKPDFNRFSFNANLLNYGVFGGHQLQKDDIYSRINIGFIEQRNLGEVDRRYFHFQSSQVLYKNLNIFGTAELDIFRKKSDIVSFTPRLTNLFLSARYRFNRNISLSLSYDSRKRILYYETDKSNIEQFLDDDYTRQGLRARLTFRPFKGANAGVSYSKRFQANELNKSENINGYIIFYQIPKIPGNVSLRYNRNVSSYNISNYFSATYSINLFKNKLSTIAYYQYGINEYALGELKSIQNIIGTNLYYSVSKTIRLGATLEVINQNQSNSYRVNSKIQKRL